MQIETDLKQHKYMLGMPCCAGNMAMRTATSLVETAMMCAKQGVSLEFTLVPNGTLIDAARNEIVHAFLKSDCDTLICVDADMTWTWPMMERLMVFSGHYPIMVGGYQCKMDEPKFIIAPETYEFNEHGLLPIKHAGFGFVALQRNVFETLEPHTDSYYDKHKDTNFKAYFRFAIEDGKYVGEDVYFFHKAKEVGLQPMVDPMIELGHMGMKEYNTPFHLAVQEALTR